MTIAALSRRQWLMHAALAWSASSLGGCAYRFGACSLYPPDVRTVAVPIVKTSTLRRGLGERLTDAIIREIESKTPLKVVSAATADSILLGRLTADDKGVLLNEPTGENRNLQLNFRIEVSWQDRRGMNLRNPQAIPFPDALATIDQPQNFIPEAGQTIVTAQQQAIQRLAEQIVNLMEAPW